MTKRIDLWPILIVQARYGGTYEGGAWVAHAATEVVPEKSMGDDFECSEWFADHYEQVGVGGTPNQAVSDLLRKRGVRG